MRGIAARASHCGALTAEGTLYTWCSWEGGPIPYGLGYETDEDSFSAMSPRRVQGALDGVCLSCVAAGSGYTLVVSQERENFSFGDEAWGCLYHGDQESGVLPKRVQALSPARGQVIKDVATVAVHWR